MLIELNEIDPEFLRSASARLGLRNLPRLLALPHARTTTDDAQEHHGLDPWVQWVGVHSGVPSSVHRVIRLGVTSSQGPQLWHALARAGYTWGVWGAMNAPLGDTRGCAFFMPDPWSYDEDAYPKALNDVLALPRYVSKNYLDVDRGAAVRRALQLVRYMLRPANLGTSARFAAAAVRSVLKTGPNVHTFTTLLDYLSTLIFVQLRRRDRPDFSLIFLNHIAHLQHQFWLAGDRIHPEMELGLRLCDAMIGKLMDDRAPGEALLLMNAFKQGNVAEAGMYGYRQHNPVEAMASLGIAGARVEQCMTNDAHLLFDRADEADRAERILTECRLSDGTKPFDVERLGPTSVFYQIDFHHGIPAGARIRSGERDIAFEAMFMVAVRTGAHVAEGDVFSDGIDVPPNLHNHEIFDVVLRHFGVQPPAAEPAAEPRVAVARR
jgi:hypothetical protein